MGQKEDRMRNGVLLFVFLFSATGLLFLNGSEPGFTREYSLETGPGISISIDHYREQADRVPVLLSFGELHFTLWMNAAGEAGGGWSPPASRAPVLTVDFQRRVITFSQGEIPFAVTEQHPRRTRLRLLTGDNMVRFHINRVKGAGYFRLGTAQLVIPGLDVTTSARADGAMEAAFFGPTVLTPANFLFHPSGETVQLRPDITVTGGAQ